MRESIQDRYRLGDIIGKSGSMQKMYELILRAASAHRSYRHVYHDRFRAKNIAVYLILRPEMPRSLVFCFGHINRTMDMLADIYGARLACHDAATDAAAMLEGNDMDRIFTHGLHEFLTKFIQSNNALASKVEEDFRFYR